MIDVFKAGDIIDSNDPSDLVGRWLITGSAPFFVLVPAMGLGGVGADLSMYPKASLNRFQIGQDWYNKDSDHSLTLVKINHVYHPTKRASYSWDAVMESGSGQKTFVYLSEENLENYWTLSKALATDTSKFPHICKVCMSPAYNGFNSIDCSNKGCKDYHGKS